MSNASFLPENLRLNLYPENNIPNQKENSYQEVADVAEMVRISKVQVPDIAVYLPTKWTATKDAVVICPGGGYALLAYDWEGEDIAKFWNSKGIAAIVLKNRLPDAECQENPHEVPLKDVKRAMRMTRYYAKDWNIDPNRIGIMGFSAGGHLASSLCTHFDEGDTESEDPIEKISCRPDFAVLMYPVITTTADFQHQGSRENLVGDDPELMKYFSSELQITKDTPPTIIIHATDDDLVPVENAIVYYQGLVKNGVSAELHIYPYGGHGFSLAIGNGYLSTWPERVIDWLTRLMESKK